MSGFFDICTRCRMTFNNEKVFREHMAMHRRGNKDCEEDKKRDELERNAVPGTMEIPNEDSILATVKKNNGKRKKLISAGIEAATMTSKEVDARFEEERKKGTVR